MLVDRSSQFLVEVLREPSGELLAQDPLGELGFLADEARFLAVSGKHLPDEPPLLRASLEPIRPADGGPRLEGIRVSLRHRDPARAPFILDVAPRIAAGRASELVTQLIEGGVLKEGDRYRARLAAAPLAPAPRPALFVDPLPGEAGERAYPVVVERLAAWGIEPRDLAAADRARPVLVRRHVLEAVKDQALRGGSLETGSLLLGHLVEDRPRDPAPAPAAWAVVFTGSVDLPEDRGTETSFTFSPDSFRRARRLSELRGRGEEVLGSQHSHGWTCPNCGGLCSGRTIFFSPQDERMARLFPVYSAFLVAGRDLERDRERPTVACYVRRDGAMQAVPFGVFG